MKKINILKRTAILFTLSLVTSSCLAITGQNGNGAKAYTWLQVPTTLLAAKSGVTKAINEFPKADTIYKGTVAWSYQHSVEAYNFLAQVPKDEQVKITAADGITTTYSPEQGTLLKSLFRWVTVNGFGLQMSANGFENEKNLKSNFWCNDSFPQQKLAVNTKTIPKKWQKDTVTHWAELGGVKTAFYGGWSHYYQ
ncbi:MAG: hypothetical protein LBT37_07030 [Lactobacillaceae bacterium]|nr:hypothetical protein [Lactobacillaceae bacterium]